MKIMKIIHNAFANPPKSWLRKMSPKIRNSSMNQMNQRKKNNMVQKNPSSG